MTNKMYNISEEPSLSVSEPAVAYRTIASNVEPSFMCSFEELIESLPEIEKEFAEGKFIPHEQMRRKIVL
jgi:hypothetical protein